MKRQWFRVTPCLIALGRCRRGFLLMMGVLAPFFSAPPAPAAENPPAACVGSEPFQFKVQVSLDGGYTWYSDSTTFCIYAYPGATADIAVRTLMTVTSGQTQGWSFSLKHDPSWIKYYGGDFTLTGVTTEGTNTATVQNGNPPDVDVTEPRDGFNGFTQGVVIDSNQAMTLGPTSNFITARACYRVKAPSYNGTYPVTLNFTHDIGNPAVRAVAVQQGQSNVPCARNFTLNVQLGGCYPQYPNCSLPSGFAASSGEEKEETVMEAEVLGAGEEPAGPEGGVPPTFKRGDSTDDLLLDISDPIFTLSYLFQAGPVPHCLDSVDANDDGRADISDAIYTLSFLFIGGPAPPSPHPFCGHDPTADELGCLVFNSCNNCVSTIPAFVELLPPEFSSETMASKDVQMADLDGDGDLDCFVPQSRGGPCQPDHVYVNRLNENPRRIEVRGDLANAAGSDYDGMGNWNLLMSQNANCFPWTQPCNQKPLNRCAFFEVTYGAVIADLGSPAGGGPDGKPDVVTVGGGDFLRILINRGTNPPTFEDQGGKLVFDPQLAEGRGGWKPDPEDAATARIYNSLLAPPGSGLPDGKNPIDLLGPLVTDREKFLVNDQWFHYVSPFREKDTRTSLDDIDAGDIDLDGDLDLLVANRDEFRFSGLRGFSLILRNRGTNSGVFDVFELDVPGHDLLVSTHDLSLGDFDGDGDLDLVFANEWTLDAEGFIVAKAGAELFRNKAKELQAQGIDPATVPNPASLFEKVQGSPVEATRTVFHSAFLDLNRDGRPDIHLDGDSILTISRGIYWNNGGGSFTFMESPVTDGLYSAAYDDLNGDGWVDMVTVKENSVKVYLSNCNMGGQMAFVEAVGVLPLPPEGEWYTALGVAIGDLDGDGDKDIVVSQGDNGDVDSEVVNRIYLNQLVPNP